MIRMRMSDVAEHIEELIDADLTIHITDDEDLDEVLAVLKPYDEYQAQIDELKERLEVIENK